MKKGKTTFFVAVIILFLAILSYNSFKLYGIFARSASKANTFNYKSTLNVGYLANIKPNDYIKLETMGVDKTYITKYVDSIEFTFDYKYEALERIVLTEEHRILATIKTVYNKTPNGYDNPIIWEKEFQIKNVSKRTNITDATITVSETFTINIDDFNSEAIRFKESLSIPTVSYLEVLMPVRVSGSDENYEVAEAKTFVATIPLAEEVFAVDTILAKTTEESAKSLKDTAVPIDSKEASIHFLVIIGSIFFIVIAIKKIIGVKDDETFNNYVEKLKKEFNDIVVETDNMVDTKALKPIVITTFEELLNLANSLEMPIILYEEANIACFYIVKGDIIYSYLVKREKIVK